MHNDLGFMRHESKKLAAEIKFRNSEIALRERELRLHEEDAKKFHWKNPLVIAILAAAIAASGNAVVAFVNGRHEDALELRREDAQRILEAIKTGDPDKAAINLQFLANIGLINDKIILDRICAYIRARHEGDGPYLPVVGIARAKRHQDNPASNPLGPKLGQLGAGAAFLADPLLLQRLKDDGGATVATNMGCSSASSIGF